MEETETEIVASREELQERINLGMDMKKLASMPEFQRLFQEGFVDNWALTQVRNVSAYNPQSRQPVMEQMLARSIFSIYCDDIVSIANNAIEELKELEELDEQDCSEKDSY